MTLDVMLMLLWLCCIVQGVR